ncbi:MAG: NfeD family protein [Candidatus Kapaibacterium sp.]
MKHLIYIIFILAAIASAGAREVAVITIDGGIGPATAAYIEGGIERANADNAEALVIRLNTPGGLLEATRDIIEDLLSAPLPVIVYVAPSGGRAGSAGVFITIAGHIAAMAPGTNIGAAHPVGLGGGSDTTAMFDKVVNDAAAFARTIAEKRDRNIEWAERAVRESISVTETEALEANVINFIAPTLDSLLAQVDGMTVETRTGKHTLHTRGAAIKEIEMNWREKLLEFISDPNIAYALLMLGIYGIFFELYSPGAIVPGVVGGISIILAGYSLQMLPVNWAGVALIALALILFILEIKIASYGMLSVAGVVSLLLGSVFLIDSPYEFMQVSLSVIITAVVVTALFFGLVIYLGLKAQFRKGSSGTDAMVGEEGRAVSEISPGAPGSVRVHGEIWSATSGENISAGSSVIVESMKGLHLKVKKNEDGGK